MRGLFQSRSKGAGESSTALPELSTKEDYTKLSSLDLVVIFKHSPTCVTSLMAHRHVVRFRAQQPDIPVSLVQVRRSRELSQHIAEHLGIEHESPQVLVLSRGKLIGFASHDEVTSQFLAECVKPETA